MVGKNGTVSLWRLSPPTDQLKVLCPHAPWDSEMHDAVGIALSSLWLCLQ